jgi:hypothetical protein
MREPWGEAVLGRQLLADHVGVAAVAAQALAEPRS